MSIPVLGSLVVYKSTSDGCTLQHSKQKKKDEKKTLPKITTTLSLKLYSSKSSMSRLTFPRSTA